MGLKRLRERKGLTQVQLSDKTGVHQQTISAYETGRKNPRRMSLELAATFGDALDCTDLRALMTEDSSDNAQL